MNKTNSQFLYHSRLEWEILGWIYCHPRLANNHRCHLFPQDWRLRKLIPITISCFVCVFLKQCNQLYHPCFQFSLQTTKNTYYKVSRVYLKKKKERKEYRFCAILLLLLSSTEIPIGALSSCDRPSDKRIESNSYLPLTHSVCNPKCWTAILYLSFLVIHCQVSPVYWLQSQFPIDTFLFKKTHWLAS